MELRLEEEEQWEEDGEVTRQFAVLDGDNRLVAKAFTSESQGQKTLDSVDDYILLKYLIQAETFKDAAEQSESLGKMFRRYEKLEREGVIVMSRGSDCSRMMFEVTLDDEDRPFNTDDELRQLVTEKCKLLYDE